jgi:hypothetical protein
MLGFQPIQKMGEPIHPKIRDEGKSVRLLLADIPGNHIPLLRDVIALKCLKMLDMRITS